MATQDTGLTKRLAEYAAGTSYERLPDGVKMAARQCILDAVGSVVVGQRLKPGRIAVRYASLTGGRPQAAVIGTKLRASAEVAAFVNGMAGHADEVDDVGVAYQHTGATIVPAALAIGEMIGANGREIINAVALGYDICARVARAVGPLHPLLAKRHTLPDSFTAFGATAAAARLMRLSVAQHRHAFAVTQMYVGTTAAYMDERDHLTKAMQSAKAAQTAVLSAILASIGVEGNDSAFEGRHGVLDTWGGDEPADLLTRGLGDDFDILKTHFKFYCAGYPIHAPVHALLRLMRENKLNAGDLRAVDLHITSWSANICAARNMPTICLEDMVALAAVLGKLGVREANEYANFELPSVKQLRDRITVHRDPEMDARDQSSLGARVRIQTNDGRILEAEQKFPPGDYREDPPADWGRLEAKFREICANHLTPTAIDSAVRQIRHFEKAGTVSELVQTLSETSSPPS